MNFNMELSAVAINDLSPFITGDNALNPYRKGADLVKLFNAFGFRDLYEFDKGGLPKKPNNDRNMSRTEYVKDRLGKLSGKPELRSLLVVIINSSENKEECAKQINDIISQEGFAVEKIEEDYIIIGGKIVQKQEIKNNAHFIDIQNQILAELDKSRVSISVAMAWFTNERLFEKLVEKQNLGVKVELVIYNDGVNAKHGIDFSQFDTVKIRSERGGIMHDKFCVIDNQVIITGSYNWSDNAEFRNEENITVMENPKLAIEYSVKFRELKKQGEK